MSRLLIIALAVAALASMACAETIIPGGSVSGVWRSSGSPFLIQGEITIPANATLTIEPGVTIIFEGHFKLIIQGMLEAMGTPPDSIVFTAADTSTGWHGLRFYDLDTQPDSSRLGYCKLAYGRSSSSNGAGEDKQGGAIFCSHSSKLSISHCLIIHNQTGNITGEDGQMGFPGGTEGESVTSGHGGAIYLTDSSPAISTSTLAWNYTGHTTGGEGGDGEPNVWYDLAYRGGAGASGGNGEAGSGGAIYIYNSAPVLDGNRFIGNFTGTGTGGAGGLGGDAWGNPPWELYPNIAGDGGDGGTGLAGKGGAICVSDSIVTLTNGLLIDNSTGEGHGGNASNGGWGYGNWSYGGDGGNGGNGYGGKAGSIACLTGHWQSENCTLENNTCGAGTGGEPGGPAPGGSVWGAPGNWGVGQEGQYAVYGDSSAIMEMKNSIIWNNGYQSVSPGTQVTYSCVQYGFAGIGNIELDPIFVSASSGDHFLSQTVAGQTLQSPCVDSGDPISTLIAGTTRTDGVQDAGIVDLGYHYPLLSLLPPQTITLIPMNPPILIPLSGGSFAFEAILTNGGASPLTFDIWILVQLPAGGWYGPVMGPLELTLSGGLSLTRLRSQNVPSSAPAGEYWYEGRIGDYPSVVWDTSGFSFTKLGAGNWGLGASDWANTGAAFDEGMTQTWEVLPETFSLEQNYPNPFNPSTAISYKLQAASHVSLRVYDSAGRIVTALVDGWREAGTHELTWDASALPSGVYFCRMQAGDFSAVQKMVLLK